MTQLTETGGWLSAAERFSASEYRVEGRDKVRGSMIYAADTCRPNMLWAAFATSPYARAKVRRVDVTASLAVPGVKAVLTAADIGVKYVGFHLHDWPILAHTDVRFIGDRVAAVAAETPAAAEEAARLVDVEYEELPPILDAFAAVEASAPVLHPDWPSYYYPTNPNCERSHPNVMSTVRMTKGDADIEAIFARASRVFEHSFMTPRQHCAFIEPHATLVWIDDDGTVHIQTVNKMPFFLRDRLAYVAGIPKEKVIVEPTAVGGDFGGKGFTPNEFPCYFLALATGRPVKYVQSYTEALAAGTTRHRVHLTLKSAINDSGLFLAHTSRLLFDGGAYAAPKVIPHLLPGKGYGAIPYRVPEVRIEMMSVYTNTVPAAHIRGPGEIQTFFAWEQHVDMIARALNVDAIEFRLQNAVRDGEVGLTGMVVPDSTAREVLHTLRRETDKLGPMQPGRARGIALTSGKMGNGTTSLTLRISADGQLEALTGVPEQGSGMHTLVQRIVGAVLHISPDRVAVRRGSTMDANHDRGAGGSRVTHIVGRSAQDAAERLRDLLEQESGMLLRDGRFVDEGSGRQETFDDIAARVCAGGSRVVTGSFESIEPQLLRDDEAKAANASTSWDFTMAAYSIEIEVDRETGSFRICDVIFVTDVGQIINPVAHQGQIDGGFIFGLGQATMEEMPIDEAGRVTRTNLADYRLPTIMDIPPFRTVLIRAKDGDGPFGAKTISEISNIGVAPAIANAIFDAVGVRLTEFPFTAERILLELQQPGRHVL